MSADFIPGRSTRIAAAAALLLLPACRDPGAPSDGPPRPDVWHFTDVTASAGLHAFRHETGANGQFWMPESIGSGVAFADVDGDGRPDVLAVTGGFLDAPQTAPVLRVYRNLGGGRFTDVTVEVGLEEVRGYGQGVYAADYDNDGDTDLFITTLGQNILLQNEQGVFRDVTGSSGLAGPDEWSTAAAFLDADGDGYLDLFVGNYVDWRLEGDVFCSIDGRTKTYCTPEVYAGIPARFYRNNGDGTFSERTRDAGFAASPGNTLGAVAADFDADGWVDLFVANDLRPNLLYHNNGDGTFQEIGLRAGVAYDERGYARAGMGVDAGIVDSTGRITYFVGNFSREPFDVLRHQGDATFQNRESASRLLQPSLPSLTFALFVFDANLDGHLDIFAVNGHVRPDIEEVDPAIRYRQPVQLFLNDGDGRFRDVAPDLGLPLTEPLAGRGGAYADIDGDGDLDLLVSENGGGLRLWRNDIPPSDERRPLRIRVLTPAGRDAVGARVQVFADGHAQEQQVRGGGSYLSSSEQTLTFGWAGTAETDSIVVYWPSGRRSMHRPTTMEGIELHESD